MHLSRRRLLAASSAAAGASALAGCGFTRSSDDSSTSGTLTFTTWGTESELAGFRSAISSFEKASSGVTVKLNAVPYEQMFTNIDAQIQAGNPPDVFRVPYYSFGAYAGAGQLLDLSTHLDSGFSDRFTPQAWAAVQNSGSPFGVPHHTDTSVILYNKDALATAGIDSVPTSLDDAWSWDEFADVARRLRRAMPDDTYPFAYNWQGNGVTRWLSWLFEADGRFLAEDLVTPAIDSDAGRAAVEFTQGFFRDRFVPPNSSVKATTYAADLWYGETVAMTFGGAFLVPDTDATVDFDWGATYAPRNVRAGGDFGGNALVATKGADPELVSAFFAHVTEAEQMRQFCAGASLLPTRADLVEGGIEFDVRPELSPVFVGQASTVQAQDSGQVASPSMASIITVLQDQLEAAFVGDQSVEATIRGLSTGIGEATAG
ncbi:ABC-type glycerol-3-phosphate transport system, substrate-binding protein [Nocardioides exalbidus]|uniref:ABC-type glycerol-3-phosphate transport system, substrate-binding protein n=1 Tax=Nocardioides exalbidus TaxID=402596 RepID=A0A1H4WNC4_9ACTN|nr:sugar ABC transporter substrate-binding protein [Nocardioides exalbidus]SEC94520.1 ABC-type glycerol-3-phosphate transport system, substrate-binding protein [Nocardioides exalbidus]